MNVTISPGQTGGENSGFLKNLELGDIFRLPGRTFEEAISDDGGPNFYRVLGAPEKRLIEVVSVDFKIRRKLPEETVVIAHRGRLEIYQNKDSK